MPAATPAAVASAAMILGGENDRLSFLVTVTRTGLREGPQFCGGEVGTDDAASADARDIAGFVGNASEQLRRKNLFGAPAAPFVAAGAGELAFVVTAAEWAIAGLAIHGGTRPVLRRDVTRSAGDGGRLRRLVTHDPRKRWNGLNERRNGQARHRHNEEQRKHRDVTRFGGYRKKQSRQHEEQCRDA